MKNLDYFKILEENPETLLDSNYSGTKERIVLTKDKGEQNKLMKSNSKVIELITTFSTLRNDLNHDLSNIDIKKVIRLVIEEFNTTGMNYSPLSQYLMVHNLSYSIFQDLNDEEKIEIMFYIMDAFIKNRHPLYLSHGYSSIVLQVMSDNYSHKRKGKLGIEKVKAQLENAGILHLSNINQQDNLDNHLNYYITPDKGDKNHFLEILESEKIDYNYAKISQGKLPDFLVKIREKYYLIEHKNMKEGGGGQDKQIVEVLMFINNPESNPNVHYITYLDGIFSNKLVSTARAKNMTQYNSILEILESYPNNYFVNTFAFDVLLKDIINKE